MAAWIFHDTVADSRPDSPAQRPSGRVGAKTVMRNLVGSPRYDSSAAAPLLKPR